jgi:hypothetical protein
VCILTLVLALAAIFLLAGITAENWGDSANAVAVTLLGICFVLHGVFITGAATFGPKLRLTTEFFDDKADLILVSVEDR